MFFKRNRNVYITPLVDDDGKAEALVFVNGKEADRIFSKDICVMKLSEKDTVETAVNRHMGYMDELGFKKWKKWLQSK